MFELSLHILDLVQNSITAGATLVQIIIIIDEAQDTMTIAIIDDGKGMDEELLSRVTSPFATTRTTRKVGLGIPMFKQSAEMCGGSFELESKVGQGTALEAKFQYSHVDRPPLGDMVGTMTALIIGAPEVPDFVLKYVVNGREFVFDTREVRGALGGVPLSEPAVIGWINEALNEGIGEANNPPPSDI